jgi:hypothetical protein
MPRLSEEELTWLHFRKWTRAIIDTMHLHRGQLKAHLARIERLEQRVGELERARDRHPVRALTR